jgi:hypothetical protein
MTPDEDPEVRSEAERRLLELLRLLADEPVPARSSERTARLLRRARLQRNIRPALLVGAGLAATMMEGLAPFVTRRPTGLT